MVVRQARARAFDCSGVTPEFLAGLGIDHNAGLPRLRRTEQEARGVLGAHARDRGRNYHPGMRECRDEIIAALVRGEDVEDVFAAIDRRLRGPDASVPA